MRTLSFVLFAATLALTGCDAAGPPPADALAQSGDRCMNVAWKGEGYLGPGTSTPLPAGPSFGLLPTPATMGPYEGMLSSAVIEEYHGGNGATHIVLSHLFDDGEGNTFWTDDQATCAASDNDPSTCRVNDVMTVVGGTGDFEGAEGQLRNHGWITFFGAPDEAGRFGTLALNVRGRICGDGL